MTSIELTVEVPDEWWMNANHRPHWTVRQARTKWLRHLATVSARRAGLPKGMSTPVRVEAWVTYPRGGKNDPNNANPTTKALIDGLTDYGCWSDDDQDQVIGPDHRHGGVTPGRRTVRLVLTPAAREETPCPPSPSPARSLRPASSGR